MILLSELQLKQETTFFMRSLLLPNHPRKARRKDDRDVPYTANSA
jgi:hypothetical protein